MSTLWADDFEQLVVKLTRYPTYDIAAKEPEWDGNCANRVLKSAELVAFFDRVQHPRMRLFISDDHECNTTNLLRTFWVSYSKMQVRLRESARTGEEPFTDLRIAEITREIARQRVWLGWLAPTDMHLVECVYGWSHMYFFHIPFFVKKYRGIGSLTQEGIELAHKEVHKDVAIWTTAGTRPNRPQDWVRIMRGYNHDLVRQWREGRLRYGKNPKVQWCCCHGRPDRCFMCQRKGRVPVIGGNDD